MPKKPKRKRPKSNELISGTELFEKHGFLSAQIAIALLNKDIQIIGINKRRDYRIIDPIKRTIQIIKAGTELEPQFSERTISKTYDELQETMNVASGISKSIAGQISSLPNNNDNHQTTGNPTVSENELMAIILDELESPEVLVLHAFCYCYGIDGPEPYSDPALNISASELLEKIKLLDDLVSRCLFEKKIFLEKCAGDAFRLPIVLGDTITSKPVAKNACYILVHSTPKASHMLNRSKPRPTNTTNINAIETRKTFAKEDPADKNFTPITTKGNDWKDIRITMLDGENEILVQIYNTPGDGKENDSTRRTYMQAGFADRKTGKPNESWNLLKRLFLEKNKTGSIPSRPDGLDMKLNTYQKKINRIKNSLKKLFPDIKGEPIYLHQREYRMAFSTNHFILKSS